MLSTETRKFILKIILLFLSSDYANGCNSNKQLYTEIGCTPIYTGDSNTCPVAYDCENVFTRPSNKCYFNGNVYKPRDRLSKTDAALIPCLASCFCNQDTYENKTTTKFRCANVECPSDFTRLLEPCYYQYERDLCCEVKKNCPDEKSKVHECNYDNNVYRDGERFYIGDNLLCVCSSEFNGTASDRSCRKVGCKYEIFYMENILNRNAPIYFGKTDGCPIEWFYPEYDAAVEINPTSKTSSYKCEYGNRSYSLGQNLTIGQQTDADTYKTTCSCNTPPLLTCIKVRIENN